VRDALLYMLTYAAGAVALCLFMVIIGLMLKLYVTAFLVGWYLI